jgi:hypothetical protein
MYVASLILLSLVSFQQRTSKIQDVPGWTAARWGMTPDQVKKAIAYPLEHDAKQRRIFNVATTIKINSIPVNVSLEFLDGKLKFVTLVVSDNVSRSLAFDSLKTALIQKYGKPSDQDSKPERPYHGVDMIVQHRSAVWVFPSTSITLDWREYGDRGSVMVIYERAESQNAL